MAAILPLPGISFPQAPVARRHITPSRDPLVAHGSRLGIIVAVACAAIFLDASTSYESSTALPYIAGAIAATPDQASWVVTLFNAAYETSILLSPWFLTRLGRRNYFVGSLLGFGLCSLGCALVSGYEPFLLLRLVQGFALGGFFACGVLSLFMSIPDGLRLIGIMLFSMASQLGSALGPAVAGYLVYNDAWQWVFVLSAVPAFVLALLIWYALRDPQAPSPVPFDVVGAALIGVTFLALQYVVNEGERRNWTDDPSVTLALLIFPVSGVALLVWKFWYSPHPFLDLRVLRHRNLVVGAVFGFGFGILLQVAAQIGGFVEETLAFTPTLGGGLDALRAIATVIVVPLVTFAIAERVLDVRAALVIGLLATFIGFRYEVVATTSDSDFGSFIVPFAGIGVGIAILYRALASVIFGSLPREDLVMGLLVYKMSGLLGGALAAPIVVTLLDHLTAARQNDLAGGVALAQPAVRSFVDHAQGGATALADMVHAQASTLAYSDIWSLASMIAVVLIPVILALDIRPAAPEPGGG
jgi:DHA2 family multidrug resistance protein